MMRTQYARVQGYSTAPHSTASRVTGNREIRLTAVYGGIWQGGARP